MGVSLTSVMLNMMEEAPFKPALSVACGNKGYFHLTLNFQTLIEGEIQHKPMKFHKW